MERITMHFATVYNAYCQADSRSTLRARTREELWAKILDGQRRGLYGDVIHTWEEQAVDPEAYEAEQAELRRIRLTSCLLPPESDLLLLAEAKRLPPERAHEIDPSAGCWKDTRDRLRRIQLDKENEHHRTLWALQT